MLNEAADLFDRHGLARDTYVAWNLAVLSLIDIISKNLRNIVDFWFDMSKAMPDVMRAAKDGWITMDHAELMAASHGRAPMTTDEQLDLLAVGVQQNPDVFKATLVEWETKRLAATGLNPTEQQRARRTAKIFNGDNDMVILHAELDHLAGERVKTAMDALTTRNHHYSHS